MRHLAIRVASVARVQISRLLRHNISFVLVLINVGPDVGALVLLQARVRHVVIGRRAAGRHVALQYLLKARAHPRRRRIGRPRILATRPFPNDDVAWRHPEVGIFAECLRRCNLHVAVGHAHIKRHSFGRTVWEVPTLGFECTHGSWHV